MFYPKKHQLVIGFFLAQDRFQERLAIELINHSIHMKDNVTLPEC
jgi:hypothetical protein